MLNSMTGYGRGEARGAGRTVTVEIRAVNQRFLDVVIRLPRLYMALEEKIRQVIKNNLSRGRVEVLVSINEENGEKRPLTVDMGLAMAYYNALKELAQNLAIPAGITAEKLLAVPEVVKVADPEWDEASLWPVVSGALETALADLLAMRRAEGQRLRADLEERVAYIRRQVEAIRERAPEVPREYARRLKERVTELSGGMVLDPGRLEMEVALLAERADITEEIVRLISHLEQMATAMNGTEPAGRRLDFILQEMWREINTIGSKAGDLAISNLVVAVKGELEKMREQVQNVE
ncbi:YicC/YloC family endoribonuclease [Moorella sulfitireducens (nom. illeg.)]|uniref:YicC/YloC family endoribonuclease n=1 Tax=Neomoorella sulfitireducens TaxID=2972948 RepID=UPI0021AC7525|nr:YicC/YloC family endoribonuclease [Moorella sulfitireducens]